MGWLLWVGSLSQCSTYLPRRLYSQFRYVVLPAEIQVRDTGIEREGSESVADISGINLTSPSGATYFTTPGSALLFPTSDAVDGSSGQ